jgi:ribosomal protein S18 acetylase RimI-like enzyme
MNILRTNDFETIARLNKDIHDLHTNLYSEYFKEYDFEVISQFFKRIVENPNYTFLLLEVEQRYIGYAWIEMKEVPENEFFKSYKSIFVHQLSVIKGEQSKGYGKKLMEKITEIAQTNNIRKIELDYWYNNDIAKDFYHKNGYTKYREFVYKEV